MSESLGTAVLTLSTDNSKFNKGIDSAQSKAQKFGGQLKSVGKNLSARVSLPLAAAGAAAIKFASDLGESANAVNVVFGEAAGTIQDFGETAARAVGLAQSDFNSLATVIGAQLKQSGMAMDEVSRQTINLTKRASDLASVYNTSVKDATNALGAALRGETEPARRFSVNISQAAIETEALAMGMISAGEQMTEAQKVQARYNVIMKQSADVAGDFANTSGQLANKTKITVASLKDAAAQLGKQLIPLALKAIDTLSTLVEKFSNLSDTTKAAILILAGIGAALGPALSVIGTAVTAFGSLATAIGVSTTALLGPVGLIAAVVALGIALGATAEDGERLRESVTGAGGYQAMRKMAQEADKTYKATKARSQALEDSVRPMQALTARSEAMNEHWGGIKQKSEDTAESAKETTKELTAQQRISNAYSNKWEEINESWRTLRENMEFNSDILNVISETTELTKEQKLEELRALENELTLNAAMLEQAGEFPINNEMRISQLERIRDLMEEITGETNKQKELMLTFPQNMPVLWQRPELGPEGAGETQPTEPTGFAGVADKLKTIGTGLKDIFSGLGENLKGTFSSLVTALKNPIQTIGNMFNGILGGIMKGVGPIIKAVMSLTNVVALLNPLQTILSGVMDILGPLVNKLLAPLVGILKITGQLIGHLLAPALMLLEPIITFIAKLFLFLYNKIAVPVVNTIAKAFNSIYNFIVQVVNFAIDMLNKIPFVSISRVRGRDPGAGTISEISLADLSGEGTADSTTSGGGGTTIDQARPIEINIDISGNEIAGEDGFRDLAIILRGELESLGVINA